MAAQRLSRKLQGLLWEHSSGPRSVMRQLRRGLSLTLHRLRRIAGQSVAPRVVHTRATTPERPITEPAIAVIADDGTEPPPIQKQTEASTTRDPGATVKTPFWAPAGGGFGGLPAVHLEAMLMVAAATGSSWVSAGWSAPAPGPSEPSGLLFCDPDADEPAHMLIRTPDPARPVRDPVTGMAVPHITSADRVATFEVLRQPAVTAAGPYRLRPDAARKPVVAGSHRPVDAALAKLGEVDGPPTVLFLLPFLAVGGAERLLFDLLGGLRDRYRPIIATTDPHLADLGQTVDLARELTPHVYPLGDWLPRDSIGSAVRHLIRRWQVRTLMCWNGSITFFDEVAALRAQFPSLRMANQLFNHRGGWIEHYSPSFVRDVDLHIAVNQPIAEALVSDRAVPPAKVVTIHHAVGLPEPVDPARRDVLRAELGVADDTLVIGTFIRMHPQKRPLDVVRLARRMREDNVHFLLVGGGPLDNEVDREIDRDPPANLTRLPLHPNASELYPAVDLCLLTSDFEGLPVFLLDGLARGIPCVATAVGSIPHLLGDGGGLVVENVGDIDELAAATRTYIDPDHRRREGDKGRETVLGRFGLDAYVSAYESVIFPQP